MSFWNAVVMELTIMSFHIQKIFKFWESGDYEAVVNMIQSKTVEVDVKDGNPKVNSQYFMILHVHVYYCFCI